MVNKNLTQEIEDLRKIMIDTAAKHYPNLSHKDVVKCSQELDQLIKVEAEQRFSAVG